MAFANQSGVATQSSPPSGISLLLVDLAAPSSMAASRINFALQGFPSAFSAANRITSTRLSSNIAANSRA
ncbi:MAG: hypothetical protein ABSH34_28080 [Verrucomicrobiota bacterium]